MADVYLQLAGFRNKWKYRFWGTEYPRNIQERPPHPSLTIWWGVFAQSVIGIILSIIKAVLLQVIASNIEQY